MSTGGAYIDATRLHFRGFEHAIISACGFFLAVDREVRNALEVADDAGEVVDVVAMAVRALGEIALVDATTFVAERVGDIEREVIAAFHSRYAEEVAILGLREVLFEIAVQGAAAGEVVDVATTVETELLDGGRCFYFLRCRNTSCSSRAARSSRLRGPSEHASHRRSRRESFRS